MCCKNFWKKIVPFALALMLGVLAVNILRTKVSVNVNQENVRPAEQTTVKGYGEGNGDGGCTNYSPNESDTADQSKIKILSKPQARYTDAARKNDVQGSVVLKVTFLPSGKTGNISIVSGLPDGLNEQAIAAAKRICFIPPKRNGVPFAITKTVIYSFTIY